MTVEVRLRLERPGFTLDVDLEIPGAGVTAVFGRSGSGKTTLLRCLAGLERPRDGHLIFNGEAWQSGRTFVPPHRRPVGYVFQESSLFPHLSVRDNLEFGLRRTPDHERRVPLDEAIALLGLEALLDRAPGALSGGQRQRVAVARALLTSPRLLLMDEPLASLDLESRAQILPYLERLRDELEIPILYVTHAPAEVVRLADRMILLEAGRARAAGPLDELLTRPDLPLAHLHEAGAVLDACVESHEPDYHLTYLAVPGGRIAISQRALRPGQRTRVHVQARDVSIALKVPEQTSVSNVLAARVVDVHADRDPAHRLVRLDAGGARLLARVTHRSAAQLGLAPGTAVFAQIKSAALLE
ncbi:molybdenum ABC transporter ATP-binding protein [Sorangium sp. So ce1024]|uniref:molybdenum ABC transporter ATP-binding protein n=1 Tax=unclassified Sorangium TaxID=2621164 RepID=UPI003F0FEA25